MKKFFLCVVLMLLGACAAPMKQMTPTQQSEAVFEAAKRAEAEKKAAELKAKSEAVAAETARRAAGKGYAAAVLHEAAATEARLAAIAAEAGAQRRKACELDPDLCPKAVPPPPALVPPVAVPQPAPPPPVVEPFVDIVIGDDWAAPKRISPYPTGWELVFAGTGEDTLVLRIRGIPKSSLKKGTLGCWRFRELAVERCPVR